MNESSYTTLEGQAVEEILKEAKRSKELTKDFGALAWQKRDVLPNKRFLNNTLVSTLRHSYRQEQKHKTGSYNKFKEHMESQHNRRRNNFQIFSEKHKEEAADLNKSEPDYGEFDATAYADKCTDLYIRDSHRKHSRMRGQFVEKVYKSDSSESEESFTEYDDLTEDKWQHDGHEDKVRYLESSYNYDDKTKHQFRKKSKHNHQSKKYISERYDTSISKNSFLTDKKNEINSNFFTNDRFSDKKSGKYHRKEENRMKDYYLKGSFSKQFDSQKNSKHDCSESHLDFNNISNETESIISSSESADNSYMSKQTEIFAKKKSKKLFKNGKDLAAIISSRSMYADIEEMKMVEGNKHTFGKNDEEDHKKNQEDLINEEKERRKTLIDRRTEKMSLEIEKDSALWKKKERFAEFDKNAMDRSDFNSDELYSRGYHPREKRFMEQGSANWRNLRSRPVNRSRPLLSSQTARGFDFRGVSMFSHPNSFYASYMYEMNPYLIGKFIQEHGHKFMRTARNYRDIKSSSRSQSRSKSRSLSDRSRSRRKYKKYGRLRRSSSRNSSSSSRSRSRSCFRNRSRCKLRRTSDSRRKHRARSKCWRSGKRSQFYRSRSRSIDFNDRSRKYERGLRSHSHSKSSHSDSDQSSSSRKSVHKELKNTLKQNKFEDGKI